MSTITRKQRRYTDEKQILDAIDKAREAAKTQQRYAESYAQEIKAIKLRGDPQDEWLLEEKAKLEAQCKHRVEKLMGARLSRLSEKLAEFRTGVFPFIEDDSVPVKIGVK